VTEFLRTHGIPTACFVPTKTGEYLWQYRDRAFHLQEYVQGNIFPSNTAPGWLMQETASLLGKLHRVFAGFPPMKHGFGLQWFQWGVDESRHRRQQYSVLLEAAEQLPSGTRRERIMTDLHYKMDLLSKASQIRIDPNKLTLRNSHGDYHILQLICGPSSVRAIIDFSTACIVPLVWEVIRSYSYGDTECVDAQINVPNLKNYVSIYLEHMELSRYDLEMMPYVKYLQLARSRYGYKEYLIAKSENRESLIEFGFWRTNMCRWLEEHAGSLSQELVELAR